MFNIKKYILLFLPFVFVASTASCSNNATPSIEKIVSTSFDRDVDNIYYSKGDDFKTTYGTLVNIPNLVLNYESGSVKTIFYGDSKIKYEGYDKNTLGKQNIKVTYNDGINNIETSYKINVVNEAAPKFKVQPSDVTISYPNSTRFHAEANFEDEVTYQWQNAVQNTPDALWYNANCSSGFTNTLEIPYTNPVDLYFRVIATAKSGIKTASNIVKLSVNNKDEFKNYLTIGEDIIDTRYTEESPFNVPYEYGSGKIYFVESNNDGVKKTTITFDNVNYTYKTKPGWNVLYSVNLSPQYSDMDLYEFKFIGENRFTKNIRDSYTYPSGFMFNINPVYQQREKKLGHIPVSFLSGSTDAKLYIYGGYAAINCAGQLSIDIDMEFENKPDLLSKGIIAEEIIFKEKHSLKASIGGELFFVQYNSEYAYEGCGNITLNNLTINAGVYPGSVETGETICDIMSFSGNKFIINNSTINIDIVVNNDIWDGREKIISSMYFICAYSQNGECEIEGSSLYIHAKSIKGGQKRILNVSETAFIASPTVSIKNSEIVYKSEIIAADEADGIKSRDINLGTSNINLDITSYNNTNGIFNDDPSIDSSKFNIENCTIEINTSSFAAGSNYGIRCYAPTEHSREFNIKLEGAYYILINSKKGIPFCFMLYYDDDPGKAKPEPDYDSQLSKCMGTNFMVDPSIDNYEININKAHSSMKAKYLYFESFYKKDTEYSEDIETMKFIPC